MISWSRTVMCATLVLWSCSKRCLSRANDLLISFSADVLFSSGIKSEDFLTLLFRHVLLRVSNVDWIFSDIMYNFKIADTAYTTCGFVFDHIALIRTWTSISKPNFIDSLEKQPLSYWNSTSGFNFDHITVFGMSPNIRLLNFVQIGPSSAELWCYIISIVKMAAAVAQFYFRFPVSNRVTSLFFW